MPKFLIRLLVGQALSQSCMSGLRAALPIYALKHGYGTTDAGLLLACFTAGTLLLSIPIGQLTDRMGLQLPWRLSVWLALAAAGICAALPNLWGLCVGAVLIGISAAFTQLASQQHVVVTSTDHQQRTEFIGWIMLAPAAASFVGPMLLGIVLEHAGTTQADYRSLLYSCAIVALLAVLSIWTVRNIASHGGTSTAPKRTASKDRWQLLRSPRFVSILFVNTFSFTCWNSYLLIVPVLAHDRDLSPSMVGAIFGMFALTTAISRPLLPRLIRTVSRRPLLIGANVACALLFAIFPLMRADWAYILCSMLLGLTLGSTQVLLMTILAEESPLDKQGEAMGIRMMTFSATNVAVPIALGSAGAFVGVFPMFLITGLIALSAAGLSFRLDKA